MVLQRVRTGVKVDVPYVPVIMARTDVTSRCGNSWEFKTIIEVSNPR